MRGAAAVLLALWPAAAGAFVCPEPDPVGDLQRAAAAAETYVVVAGELEQTGNFTDRRDAEGPGLTRVFPMQVRGRALGRSGFVRPVTLDFALGVYCTANDLPCLELPTLGEALVFLRREADGALVLEAGLCSDWLHALPEAATLEAVARCHTRGDCGA